MKLTNKKKYSKNIILTSKSKTKKKRIQKNNDPYKDTELYPPIKPLKSYKMKVSKLHTIAFWTYGNKNGKPVLFIHGGPGSCTTPTHARFFNPKKYYIILVDQRGCGKSKPTAEIEENNTQNLIEDFEKIRNFLNIKKWMIFGGSWGSTLSLAYSISYPENISEIILRGIFLCSKAENDWLIEPNGVQYFNPEAWDYYESSIPEKDKYKNNYIKAFEECFKGKYGNKKREQCLLAWSAWEDSNSTLIKKPFNKILNDLKKEKKYIEMSILEQHYFKNNCFLETGFFLKSSNLNKLRSIPIIIVQGMYDLVCPFINAYRLHKELTHSIFYPTLAGHSALDKENIKYLVKATNYFI
jgi:proline iminopeptidase